MTWSLLKESAFVSHELVLVYIWHEQFLRCSWPQLHGRRCCVAGNLQMRDGLICLIAENCTCYRICIIFKYVPFCFRCLVHPYSHSIVQVNMQSNGTKFHNSHKKLQPGTWSSPTRTTTLTHPFLTLSSWMQTSKDMSLALNHTLLLLHALEFECSWNMLKQFLWTMRLRALCFGTLPIIRQLSLVVIFVNARDLASQVRVCQCANVPCLGVTASWLIRFHELAKGDSVAIVGNIP